MQHYRGHRTRKQNTLLETAIPQVRVNDFTACSWLDSLHSQRTTPAPQLVFLINICTYFPIIAMQILLLCILDYIIIYYSPNSPLIPNY